VQRSRAHYRIAHTAEPVASLPNKGNAAGVTQRHFHFNCDRGALGELNLCSLLAAAAAVVLKHKGDLVTFV
jgi:hypothetical protein